jgi:hypothetical protein
VLALFPCTPRVVPVADVAMPRSGIAAGLAPVAYTAYTVPVVAVLLA